MSDTTRDIEALAADVFTELHCECGVRVYSEEAGNLARQIIAAALRRVHPEPPPMDAMSWQQAQASGECSICRMQTGRGHGPRHWAWHRFCRGELNPVAFVEFLDHMPQTPEVERIRRSLIALTGMDVEAARAALAVDGPPQPEPATTPEEER